MVPVSRMSRPVDFMTGNFDVFGNVGDLNGDGRPDLIAVNVLLNTITILRNNIGSPVINSISDSIGKTGKSILITGRGFADVTGVSFGNVPASSFLVISPTLINAVVNDGASGDVSVTTVSGMGTISGFRFIPGIVYQGSTDICNNTPFVLHSTASSGNQWYKDSAKIPGETGNKLQVATGGFYSVTASSNGIVTSSDSGVTVHINTVSVPSISKNQDNILVSSISNGNQWYLNGLKLTGETNDTCVPWKNGLYTVTHFENGCISDYSNAYSVDLTDNIDLGNGQYARFYPNPVTTILNIQWNINDFSALSVSISDMQGKPVLIKNDFQKTSASINLSILPPGIYLLKIADPASNINKTVKIVKTN